MKQALSILLAYITCTDPAVKTKWANILASFWHKDEGSIVTNISKATNGDVSITLVDASGEAAETVIEKTQLPTSYDIDFIEGLNDALNNKVTKVSGKGLSTNDFTNTLKSKLEKVGSIAEIPDAVDLDIYRTDGRFYQPWNVQALSGTNYPAPHAGLLEVRTYNHHVHQTYIAYGEQNAIYFRARYGTWSSWQKCLTTQQPIGSAELKDELKATKAMGTGTVVDWGAGIQFEKTLTADATLTFSNLQQGKTITLVVDGAFNLTLPAGFSPEALDDYDNTKTNYIQIYCANATAGSEVFLSNLEAR